MTGPIDGAVWKPIDAFGDFPAHKKNSPEELRESAEKFEALLIAQLLRSARQARGGEEGGENPVMELADDKLAESLSTGGGLGLSRMIVEQVRATVTEAGVAQHRNGTGTDPHWIAQRTNVVTR